MGGDVWVNWRRKNEFLDRNLCLLGTLGTMKMERIFGFYFIFAVFHTNWLNAHG